MLKFVCNKHDKVIFIVFRTLNYPGFPSFYFYYIPINTEFSFPLKTFVWQHIFWSLDMLELGILGQKLGKKDMICHWEYSRISAIKWTEKKPCIVTLTFDLKVYRVHTRLMGRLHVKFHEDRCKGEAVMRKKPFSVILALWPWTWTFWP